MSGNDLYKPSAYPPAKAALLLLDYQNILVNMLLGPTKDTLINSVENLLAAARKNYVAIVHCIMDTTLDPTAVNKVAATWATLHKPVFSADPQLGTEFASFAPTGRGADREIVYKRSPGIRSGLESEGIVAYLRDKLGVTHLILGGIVTSGAILGTMSHSTDTNFVVSVVKDACWDPDEQVHRNLIDTVIPTLAWVSSVEEAVGYMTD